MFNIALKTNFMLTSMKGHYSWTEYSKLNTLVKLTLLGLVYVYTVKLIDTLYHGIFKEASIYRLTSETSLNKKRAQRKRLLQFDGSPSGVRTRILGDEKQ